MKLYCVRHCEANGVDVDPERGLSAQGLEDANKLGEHLRQQKIIIPEVLKKYTNFDLEYLLTS